MGTDFQELIKPTHDMKKLPNWAKLVIVVIGLAIGYKFGYAVINWLLDLLNF